MQAVTLTLFAGWFLEHVQAGLPMLLALRMHVSG